MLKVKLAGVLCVLVGLSACSPAEMPSRARTDVFPAVANMAPGQTAAQAADALNVVSYTVDVPRELLVSEADVFLPNADIVWHGDPAGDRYEQVEAIFATALDTGTAQMTSGHAVTVQIQVQMFHALTPKTRATMGGNFAMHFVMTVLDAETGAVLDGPRAIVADTAASGGRKALREEAQGLTQKVVIVARLAEVIAAKLQEVELPDDQFAISRNAFSPADLTLAQ